MELICSPPNHIYGPWNPNWDTRAEDDLRELGDRVTRAIDLEHKTGWSALWDWQFQTFMKENK